MSSKFHRQVDIHAWTNNTLGNSSNDDRSERPPPSDTSSSENIPENEQVNGQPDRTSTDPDTSEHDNVGSMEQVIGDGAGSGTTH